MTTQILQTPAKKLRNTPMTMPQLSHLEKVTYSFKPAGHQKGSSTRSYQPPPHPLKKAFEQWLVNIPSNDVSSVEDLDFSTINPYLTRARIFSKDILGTCKPTVTQLHSLVIDFQDHPSLSYAGIFLSEWYKTIDDRLIVWDIDGPFLPLLGYQLPAGKTLINTAIVGNGFGQSAHGSVINAGKAGRLFARYSHGLSVNIGIIGGEAGEQHAGPFLQFGTVNGHLGHRGSGIFVRFGTNIRDTDNTLSTIQILASGKSPTPKKTVNTMPVDYSMLIITPHDFTQLIELNQYVSALRNSFIQYRQDPEKLSSYIDTVGEDPGQAIHSSIETILEQSLPARFTTLSVQLQKKLVREGIVTPTIPIDTTGSISESILFEPDPTLDPKPPTLLTIVPSPIEGSIDYTYARWKLYAQDYFGGTSHGKKFEGDSELLLILGNSVEILGGKHYTLETINSFIETMQDTEDIFWMGPFLSALYTTCPDNLIVLPEHFPVMDSVGIGLSREKTLINFSEGQKRLCYFSQGHVITIPQAPDPGRYSTGLVLQFGPIDAMERGDKWHGLAANLGNYTSEHGPTPALQIFDHLNIRQPYKWSGNLISGDEFYQSFAPLVGYLNDLLQTLRTWRDQSRPVQELIDQYGPNPGKTILIELHGLLKKIRGV